MPYINGSKRIDILNGSAAITPGELNYKITLLLIDYWNRVGHKYQTINDIIGALECAKLEFNRRVVVDYENQKALENGEVY